MLRKGTAAERDALTGMSEGDEFIVNSGAGAGSKQEYRGATAGWVQTHDASGAASVSDAANPAGIARNRFISATTGTLPTLAGSGVATYVAPGVKGLIINSVNVVSGTLPTAANANFAVRYAIDAASDAAAAVLLPITINTSSLSADIGQVGSFNLVPVWNGTSFTLLLEKPVYIDVTNPITRFDLIHNLGTTLILQFQISAVEEV